MINQISIDNTIIIFFVAIILIFISKKIAPYLKLIDYPDQKLKVHSNPIPATGGLAILLVIVIGVTLNIQSNLTYQHISTILFLLGVFSLGILDDKLNLKIITRVVIQFLLSSILLFFIQPLNIFNIYFFDLILSIIFCMACINAINILDIMDGLAGGVAFFSILNCLIFIDSDFIFYSIIGYLSLVALLAFLLFNFNPAKIFMGNAGSTFIGGLIAILVLIIFQRAHTIQEKLSYLFPVAVMFFELLFVIIVRLKKGLNPMKGSPDHLALRIRKLNFTVKETVLIIYSFSGFCVIYSILVNISQIPILLIIIFLMILLIIGIRMSKDSMRLN